MLSRLSLRARLLIAVIALAAVGLVVADVVTYSSLRSFLVDRVDRSLEDTAHSLRGPGGERGGEEEGRRPAEPGVFAQIRSATGDAVVSTLPSFSVPGGTTPDPRLPAVIDPPTATDDGPEPTRYFTVPGESSSERYRVRASVDARDETMLVVATSLDDVDSTLDRLLRIELVVTALVLAGIAALGMWLVRLGLRPLDAIGETASAIAAGDLSRRVERAEDRTEVGRLGLALNAMLSQIESAFRAREASERKLRRFVADASHELRTPLAAVRAYAELFGRGASERPDDLARSMTGISRESERMSLLVDDLLLLARLDEGRPLERERVELDQLVAEAVEMARAVEPDRPIALQTEPASVVGDRERLRQVVDNLLANVRTHTPPGTPVRVAVTCENGTAEIVVADSGPGMEADALAHVFERFYRTDASRARASGGVGLGLAIVAAVTEAHGGTALAESEAGRGATFTIALPLADGNECGSGRAPRRITADPQVRPVP
jgi:two-component system, OmpR family, sensor kinase